MWQQGFHRNQRRGNFKRATPQLITIFVINNHIKNKKQKFQIDPG
jgi:hypothetical protein